MAEAEYISKEAALACFSDWIDRYGHEHSADEMAEYQRIEDLPVEDVRPVVRGKWIIHEPFDSGRHNCNECIECSVCGTWFGHDCYEISNFCPNCGCQMKGERK